MRAIKSTYDPNGLFVVHHGVGSEEWSPGWLHEAGQRPFLRAQVFSRRKLLALIALMIGAGYFSLYRAHFGPAETIAVLPLIDLTAESIDRDSISDKLSNRLTEDLDALPGLRVIPATTAFLFKNTRLPVKILGARLGVSYLIEGSIRRFNSSYRIAIRVVYADEGFIIYEGTYQELLSQPNALASISTAAATNIHQFLEARKASSRASLKNPD